MPARAHLGRDERQGGDGQRSRTTRRASAAGPSRSSSGSGTTTCAWTANKDFFLGAPNGRTSSSSSSTRTATPWSRTSRPATSTPPTCSRPRSSTALKSTEGVEAIEYPWFNWDYVGFNCYEGESTGNPVLRDQHFRGALEYGDRPRRDRRDGLRRSRDTRLHVHAARRLERSRTTRWAPAEGEARNYDPGHGQPDARRCRLPRHERRRRPRVQGQADQAASVGRPSESPEAAAGRASSSRLVGGRRHRCRASASRTRASSSTASGTTRATRSTPDFDAYLWLWDGYFDPGQTLDVLHDRRRSRAGTSSPGSTKSTTASTSCRRRRWTPTSAPRYIKQMQEVMYEDAPCIVTVHPYKLEAYRT